MFHTLVKQAIRVAREDEFADEISCPPSGLPQRHAETDNIFGVHGKIEVMEW